MKRDDKTEVEFEFYSLPVELTWKVESSDDPFLPMKVLFFSLTDLFLDHVGIANDGLDQTTDLLTMETMLRKKLLKRSLQLYFPVRLIPKMLPSNGYLQSYPESLHSLHGAYLWINLVKFIFN